MTAAVDPASGPVPKPARRRGAGPSTMGPPALGTSSLILGTAVLVLRSLHDAGIEFSMPAFWYANRTLWYAVGLGLCGFGIAILRERPAKLVRWRPSKPGVRFRQLLVYTRPDCPLCDEAMETLLDYRQWMPRAEVEEIDSDPELQQRFGDWVPVVQIDGRIRFKGRVNEVLLRRLIEGTAPIDSASPARSL